MSRELKFRVWFTKDSFGPDRMIYSPRLYIEQSPELKIMQFTGLKDQNGKNIYEGDIVQDNQGQYYQIIFNNILARFELSLSGFFNVLSRGSYNTQVWESDCLTIKGNIFENPELLNNK